MDTPLKLSLPTFLLALALAALSAAGSPVLAAPSAMFAALRVEYRLERNDEIETLAQVLASSTSFAPMPADLKVGYTSDGLWIRLVVVNHGTAPSGYLIFEDTTPNLVEVYVMPGRTPLRGGSFVPLSERDVVSRAPTFLLTIPPGESRTLYARFASFNIISPEFHFESTQAYAEKNGVEELVLGTYYGAAVALFLYNFFLYLSIRDRNYLLYSGFILGTSATFFCFDGFADLHLGDLLTGWQVYTTGLGQVALMMAVVFSRRFLDVSHTAPRFDRLMRAVIALNLVGVVIAFSPWTVLGGYIVDVSAAVNGLVVVLAGLFSRHSGFRPARFYLLSWIILFTMTLVWLGGMHGALPRNALTTHGILLGAMLEMIVMSLALGDRVKLIQNAAKEQEAIARAARMIAHDVRKPFSQLDAILSALASESQATSPAALREFARRRSVDVREAMRFVDGLLEEVMGFGRKEELKRLPVDPAELVGHVLRSGIAFPPRVKVEVDAGHTLLVAVDSGKIHRVLLNILDNAAAAIGAAEGRVWLRTTDAFAGGHGVVRLVVGNDGPRIAAEDLGRIFEPFFTKGKARGTGLGLAVCREIVAAHGGSLSCTSTAAGGTEFVIELPATQLTRAALVPAIAPAPAAPLPASTRALAVVDDCPFVREAWEVSVPDAEVSAFASPQDFFARLAADVVWRARLAAVVTDFDFGAEDERTGAALAREMARITASAPIPVLLSSDWQTLSSTEMALFAGRIDKRPASLASLLAPLRRLP